MDRVLQWMEYLRGLPWLRFAVAPLLGALIGYVTNDLALKMLFRPYEEVRLGRFRLPFTPGLIPRQRARIARSLGGVIANHLLDADTLRRELLSEENLDKLRAALNGWLEAQAENERPLGERLEEGLGSERAEALRDKLTERAADLLMGKLREAGLGEIVAEQVLLAIRGKLNHIPMGFLFEGALEPMRASIAESVERKIAEDGPELIRRKLTEAEDALLAKSAAELCAGQRGRIPELSELLIRIFREQFDSRVGALLGAIHLDEIIQRKIDSFDARELETVLFGVVRRELRAIVYLGALLGFLLGFVNLLF